MRRYTLLWSSAPFQRLWRWALDHKVPIAVTALGLAMRILYRFWGGSGMEHDERFTYWVCALPWDRFFLALLHDVHPPLYYILAKLFSPHLVALASSAMAGWGIRSLAGRIRPGAGDWALAAYMLWPAMAQEGSMARMYPTLHALSAWALAASSPVLWGLAASTHHLAWPAAVAWWALCSRRPGDLAKMALAGAPGLVFLAWQADRPHFANENRHGIWGSLVMLGLLIGPATPGPMLSITVIGAPVAIAVAILWLWRNWRPGVAIAFSPGLYGWAGGLMLPRYWGAGIPALCAAFGGAMAEERRLRVFFSVISAAALAIGPLPFREPPRLPSEAKCWLMIGTDTFLKLGRADRDMLYPEWDIGAGLHPITVKAMGIPIGSLEEAQRRGCWAAWVEPYGPSRISAIAAAILKDPYPIHWGGGTIWISKTLPAAGGEVRIEELRDGEGE
ncbi:hypothetical protein [Thermoflexus sp.]|uniref:hypothetical protein n=1 Tax=Thermoflexus sp. TaxID=1969742 RepID=UPI002ADE3A5A|nr:hypothetical protein [Thermoflexus sp.]